jgi:thioesterase superfamily protein
MARMMRHAERRAFAIFAKGPEFSRNHSPFQCFCSAAVLRKLRVMTRDEQTAISSAELQELVLPGMANHHGTLFAGLGLQLMAKAAFMAARKLARREVVMAGASGIDFMRPIPVGRTLALRAWVSRVGRSSMTVCISGFAEAPGARREEVLKGVFVMVAVDGQGRPAAIDAARAHAAPAPQTPEVS